MHEFIHNKGRKRDWTFKTLFHLAITDVAQPKISRSLFMAEICEPTRRPVSAELYIFLCVSHLFRCPLSYLSHSPTICFPSPTIASSPFSHHRFPPPTYLARRRRRSCSLTSWTGESARSCRRRTLPAWGRRRVALCWGSGSSSWLSWPSRCRRCTARTADRASCRWGGEIDRHWATQPATPGTWAEQFESFERTNLIRETNEMFDSCKWLGTICLHELHESILPFVSRIEFIRSKLSNCSAHVSGGQREARGKRNFTRELQEYQNEDFIRGGQHPLPTPSKIQWCMCVCVWEAQDTRSKCQTLGHTLVRIDILRKDVLHLRPNTSREILLNSIMCNIYI